jgi:hypothetical protein
VASIGSTPSLLLGIAAGGAASAAFEPALEIPRQEAWKAAPHRVLDPELLARLVAQGGVALGTAEQLAQHSGYSAANLDALVYLAQSPPGESELMFLWRHQIIDTATWRQGMVKLGRRPDWIARIEQTFSVPLTAAEAAVAIHHHVIPNQGQLPGLDLSTTGKVLRFPLVPLDAYASAQSYGYGNDQLDAITRTLGLPPGLDMVARMVFRGILDRGDFTLAALQSNRRTEWQQFEFEGYRQIPTAEQFVEAHLRGWITLQEMHDGAALHGMRPADADLEYQIHRRPLTVRQITQAKAWGGSFNPQAGELQDPYDASVHQANLGPEWYELGKALKHTYSVPFWWRSMVSAGAIAAGEAETILLRLGNPPDFAARAVAHFAGATAEAGKELTKAELLAEHEAGYITTAEYSAGLQALGYSGTGLQLELELGAARQAKAYRDKVVEAIHKAYLEHELDDTAAISQLATVSVTGDQATRLLRLWQLERQYTRTRLSEAQVVKAYGKSLLTEADALARLRDFGLSPADAATRLAEG